MNKVRARVELKKLPINATSTEKWKAFEKLKRDFKKAVHQARVLHDLKDHEFFVRKCDIKRRKKAMKALAIKQAQNPIPEKEGGIFNG